jgi:hypothetical protein
MSAEGQTPIRERRIQPRRHKTMDWVFSALGVALALSLTFSSSVGHTQNNPATPAQQPKQQQAAPTPSPVVPLPIINPDYYKIWCERPKDHDAANLCEQRRMAKAAEDGVWWARTQTWLGGLGLVGVICTLSFTGISAKAAVRSANTAEDAFRRLERPYLFVRVDDLHCLADPPPPHQPYVTCRFVNYGKLPAILRSVAVRLEYEPALPLKILGDHKFYDVIQQGEVSTRPHQEMVQDSKIGQSLPVHAGLVLHGLISYEDPTGAIHTDRFCLRGLEDGAGFRVADEEYNWRKTEYPKAISS